MMNYRWFKAWRDTFIIAAIIFGHLACEDGKMETSNDTETEMETRPSEPETSDDDINISDPGLTWIPIPGGTFEMGNAEGESNEQPVHTVTVSDFEMTKSEITVAQYRVCVEADECWQQEEGVDGSTWGREGFDTHPINYITWYQADVYCKWAGGRLPSEAEWEYAARSGGQDIPYPWGDDAPSCKTAVFNEIGIDEMENWGCGTGETSEVCSRPQGNTFHGLCDINGNVWEWVDDWYHTTYEGAPTDGSSWEEIDLDNKLKVAKSGGYSVTINELGNAFSRLPFDPKNRRYYRGFRCAR